LRRSALLTIGLLILLHSLNGQTPLPYALRVQQAQNVVNIADGGTVTFAADAVGVPSSAAALTITYRGTTTATITAVDLTGSLDFAVSGLPDAPFTQATGDSVTATIRFLPTSAARVFARVGFSFTEGAKVSSFSVNLTGTAPDFAFSYTPQGGNATPIATGGAIPFPLTAIDTTSTATVIIANRGTSTGLVQSVSSTGAAFQLAGLPLAGASVEAGKDLRFTVQFTPRQLDLVSGTLTVELIDRRLTFALEGAGSGPLYAYELVADSGAAPIQPNQLLNVPDANIGEKSALTVRFRNAGNADGRIAAIGVSGAGFTLSDLPFLPLTLPPGGTATLTIAFAPTQAGRSSGRLRIGNDNFDITSNGLGSILNYAFIISGVSSTISPNGTVFFPPSPVGAAGSLQFQINNTGTSAGSVSSVAITTATTVFALTGLPALPLSIPAGGSASFTVTFTPTALGTATAALRVDNQSFTLSGTGTQPAPLPAYRFDGASGTQEPLQQPAVGLRLDSTYPLALTGTLTLAFNSEVFSNDPSVQFSIGGRTINFTIPANSTRAVFSNNATDIRVQTGTVAGTILLTPSFVTEGGINLTPTSPPALSLAVAQSAPRVLNVVVSARGASTITLLVTGYATARAITQLDLAFTPVAGETVSTSRISVNVDATFLAWYQSALSQQFGSLFTATVPLTVVGDVKGVATPGETVQSISVTLANRFGTSPARSVDVR